MWENGKLTYTACGNENWSNTVENNLARPSKLKVHIAHNPVISLPGIYAKQTALLQKQIAMMMFTSALTVVIKNWEKPTYQIGE